MLPEVFLTCSSVLLRFSEVLKCLLCFSNLYVLFCFHWFSSAGGRTVGTSPCSLRRGCRGTVPTASTGGPGSWYVVVVKENRQEP